MPHVDRRSWIRIAGIALVAVFTAAGASERENIRLTKGGGLEFEWRGDYLIDIGVEVFARDQLVTDRLRDPSVLSGSLRLAITSGQFGGFLEGRLEASSSTRLRHGNQRVTLDRLVLIPVIGDGHPVIEVLDGEGRDLFRLEHLHVMLEGGRIVMNHGQLVAQSALAELLSLDALDGQVLGRADLSLPVVATEAGPLRSLDPPDGGRGLSCDGRPFWPQDGHDIDVALIGMEHVQYLGTSPEGLVKLAPSARLRNVSDGDVPWIAKFESDGAYPYTPEDQHPYLVWSLYRLHDGRFEQLAVSGVKHAFNTINQNCNPDLVDCSYLSGNVLGPDCEDIYSVTTNDENGLMGPRDEVEASIGRFESSPSFFDPGGTGDQTHNAGSFENRLLVDPAELDTPGAEYFVESWYVIQCDAEIWNSMGYREVDPEPLGSGWEFNEVGDFQQGPAISEWISPGLDPSPTHVVVTVLSEDPDAGCPGGMPQGHLRLLVDVEGPDEGEYRYRYAVQNFDLDRGVERIGFPVGASPDADSFFSAAPNDMSTWAGRRDACQVEFVNHQAGGDWLALNNVEFVTTAAPVEGSLALELAGNGSPGVVWVDTLVPAADGSVFCDAFRDRPVEE